LQTVGDEFAKTVDGLEAVSYPGEEAYSALMRLSTSLQIANESFALLDRTLYASTLTGANYASQLVELMGGSDEFTKSLDTYFTTMFSETEQQAALTRQATRQVNTAFADMNAAFADDADITIPATREQFRLLVDSLDLTSERGKQPEQGNSQPGRMSADSLHHP